MVRANIMDRDQAPRHVEPDLRSILFDTKHQIILKTNSFAWTKLTSEDIEKLSILQIVQGLLEGTVFLETTKHSKTYRKMPSVQTV